MVEMLTSMLNPIRIVLILAIMRSSHSKLKITIIPEIHNETMVAGHDYNVTCSGPGIDPESLCMAYGDVICGKYFVQLRDVSESNRGVYACYLKNDQKHVIAEINPEVGRSPQAEIVGCELIGNMSMVTCTFRPSIEEIENHSIIYIDYKFLIKSKNKEYTSCHLEKKSNHCTVSGDFTNKNITFSISLNNDLGSIREEKTFNTLKIFRFLKPTVTLHLLNKSRMSVTWTLQGSPNSFESLMLTVESFLNCSNTTTERIYSKVFDKELLTYPLDFQLRPYTMVTCRVKVRHIQSDIWSEFGLGSKRSPPAKPSAPPILGPLEKKEQLKMYINPPPKLDRNGIILGFKSDCKSKTLDISIPNYVNYETFRNCQVAAYNDQGLGVVARVPDIEEMTPTCTLEVFFDSAYVYCNPDNQHYSIYLIRRFKDRRISSQYLEFIEFGADKKLNLERSQVLVSDYNLGFTDPSSPHVFVNTLEGDSWWTCAYGLPRNRRLATFDKLFSVKQDCGHLLKWDCVVRLVYLYPNCVYFDSPPEVVKLSVENSHYSFLVHNNSVPYEIEMKLPKSQNHTFQITITLKDGSVRYFSESIHFNGRIIPLAIIVAPVVIIFVVVIIYLTFVYRQGISNIRTRNPYCFCAFNYFQRNPPTTFEIHHGTVISGNKFEQTKGNCHGKKIGHESFYYPLNENRMDEIKSNNTTSNYVQRPDSCLPNVEHYSTNQLDSYVNSDGYCDRPNPYDKITARGSMDVR